MEKEHDVGDLIVVNTGDGRHLFASIIDYNFITESYLVEFADEELVPRKMWYEKSHLSKFDFDINEDKGIECECGVWKAFGKKVPIRAHANYCPVSK